MIRQLVNRVLLVVSLFIVACLVVFTMALHVMLQFAEQTSQPMPNNYVDYGGSDDPFVVNTNFGRRYEIRRSQFDYSHDPGFYVSDYTDGYQGQ